MPPKKGKGGASKKTEQKQKQKIVEDKTFGLKNKNKSSKVQKYVQQTQQQVMNGGARDKDRAREEKARKEREAEKARKAEIAAMFKPVAVPVQKLAPGADPKSVLCQFFAAGTCQKGNRCKFSHDRGVTNKSAKRDVYTDVRKEDTMEDWDQAKLEEVVNQKHASGNQNRPTDIVCKYFLDALEDRKYGWFWECPNGNKTCKYRHALPPGFVLKSKKNPLEDLDEEERILIEDEIEQERAKLDKKTPVTLESFKAWKAAKNKKKEEQRVEKEKADKADKKAGRKQMSGRDLFEFNPDMFQDDDDAADEYERDSDNEDGHRNDDDDGEPTTAASGDGGDGPADGAATTAIKEDLFAADDLPDDEEFPDDDELED